MSFLKRLCSCDTKDEKGIVNQPKNTESTTTQNNENIEKIKNDLPKRHLICDDANFNRLVLKRRLNMYGCEADEAENGLDAIEKLKTANYNVVWMDIKMPKMDGIDATKHIRTQLNYKYPIIGLTGYVDEITIQKCKTAGMNFVVSKPFDKKVIQMYCEKY
jgi:CheY-like chemotaxis protein